jgi:hypothetical protein
LWVNSGFLRALEFYDGILFLTTNRVGSFDDAFISRIHVPMYYPDFDDEQRRKVWQTFIDKLARERGGTMRLNIDAKEYIRGPEMKEMKWNGREIRNGKQSSHPRQREPAMYLTRNPNFHKQRSRRPCPWPNTTTREERTGRSRSPMSTYVQWLSCPKTLRAISTSSTSWTRASGRSACTIGLIVTG